MTPQPHRGPPSTRCPHRVTPTSRHRAAAAFVGVMMQLTYVVETAPTHAVDDGPGDEPGGAAAGWAADWEPADEAGGPERQLDELQQLHAVRQAMDRLDARCRDLLALLFRDEDEHVGYDEVARRMAMPVGSIGPTRNRCLGKLRRLVEPGARRP